jgi:hypothetical protein
MLASPFCHECIQTLGGPDSFNLICRDAHSNAGAAYQETPVEITPGYRIGNLDGDIRIIYRFAGKASKVLVTMPGFLDMFDNLELDVYSSLVTANRNTHYPNLLDNH